MSPDPREAIPNVDRLIDAVLRKSTGKDSFIHGESHWKRVAAAGLSLLPEIPGADPVVVFLFALFHDSMRLNDGRDPLHGPRGAQLARELRGEEFDLDNTQMGLLEFACEDHTSGGVNSDPTVGVCWDSDRLNLWRVGIRPDPRWLSTEAARSEERIRWARDLQHKDLDWEALWQGFELGSGGMVRYHDYDESEELTCSRCSWSGTMREGATGSYGELFQVSCPQCEKMLLTGASPKVEDEDNPRLGGIIEANAVWDGFTRSETFNERGVRVRQELADCTKNYDWPAVLAILSDHPNLVNVTRPGGRTLYAPLHQAAHGGAPVGVIQRMLELGAWRTLQNARGERPVDIASKRGQRHLMAILEPVLKREVPLGILLKLQSRFHEVIRERASHLVEQHALRLPELEPLLELEHPQTWFAVPGMYGGFSYRLEKAGVEPKLITESWCRVVDGSGHRHEITPAGSRLVEEGFV